ncbi:MAG TPA: tetratricopeptide repeat protein [Micropepsaceae bacterium]|nr:tetratricopeptide repeat protein [Micropepsaceae bacterium]
MRPMLLSLLLLAPLATTAMAQSSPSPANPHQLDSQGQVPDLQLIPPGGPDNGAPKAPPGPQAGPPQQGAAAARPGRPPPKAPETDDQLLTKLAKAPDQRAARPIERELKARWAHSGSPSADLLLKRTDQAMEAHDFDTARDIAVKLTGIAPNFAEAWHRRATLATQKDDYEDALTSLRRTLALQPKNFAALAELGEILEEYNDKPHALDAYRQAKAIDPFLDGLADRIRDLTKSVEGQGI